MFRAFHAPTEVGTLPRRRGRCRFDQRRKPSERSDAFVAALRNPAVTRKWLCDFRQQVLRREQDESKKPERVALRLFSLIDSETSRPEMPFMAPPSMRMRLPVT